MQIKVWITTRFTAFHRWLEAPNKVAFLRDFHRHVFHVRLEMAVNHANRDIEFIQLKQDVDGFIQARWEGQYHEMSCEVFALTLLDRFGACCVEVSEDGENGARVERN